MAGVAQWIECRHENQRVTGLIPSQGTCLSSGQVSRRGRSRGNHTLVFLSFSFSPLPLSKNKINKILKKNKTPEKYKIFQDEWGWLQWGKWGKWWWGNGDNYTWTIKKSFKNEIYLNFWNKKILPQIFCWEKKIFKTMIEISTLRKFLEKQLEP